MLSTCERAPNPQGGIDTEEPRIEIRQNGPYVLYGDVPLLEMAPVHTFNGEPIAWHTLREIPVRVRPVELCRCGRTSRPPFCDATHERMTFDGAEVADRRPFLVRAEAITDGYYAIADDRALCFSAGFCGTRTTDVWKLLGAPRDGAAQDLMRDMVSLCPSGRLVLLEQQRAIEPDLPKSIAVLPGGPIWVRGGVPIFGSQGDAWEVRNRVTLCRCGRSANKPFCDGTHMTIHFDER